MDARKGNVYEILNGFKQFVIPVYQRAYSWENEQCQRLWKDIFDMQKQNKHGHFVGSIVNIAEQAMPTGVQVFMIIDGQQRMTTLTLLLAALRDYAIQNPADTTVNANMITSMLLKNDYQSGDDRYKMLLTQSDKEALICIVDQKPLPTAPSRVVGNYHFFQEKIRSGELAPAKIYESIGKLQIVNITLDRQVDDPQEIFESLNSTGMDLSQSDLIRNYILMGLSPIEQTDVYEKIWRPMELLFHYENQGSIMDRFFRDYLTMKLARIPNENMVYTEFKRFHGNSGFATTKELCQDLYIYAKYYTAMYFCTSSDPQLCMLYRDIEALRMQVVFPFLLKVHSDYATGIIKTDELTEIIQLCISYIVRRAICNIPTNSLNKTFATMKNEIRQSDYLNSVKAFFILRDSYKEFPDDKEFSDAFCTRDIYTMRIRNFILSHLENYNNKAPITIENYTIEHIMPQNPNLSADWIAALGADWKQVQAKYLHTIGNLTLTAYNSEMSDHSFTEKMNMNGGFKQSALRINSSLVLQNTWNQRTIEARAHEMQQLAVQIWPYPQLSEQDILLYKPAATESVQYSIDTYDQMNASNRMLFDKLDMRIMNISSDVKREFKKLYIAYKLDTNFVDVVVQKSRLRLSINMKFSDVVDPKGMCRNIEGLGRWGNGDVELFFESLDQLDDVMDIILQSYQAQAE